MSLAVLVVDLFTDIVEDSPQAEKLISYEYGSRSEGARQIELVLGQCKGSYPIIATNTHFTLGDKALAETVTKYMDYEIYKTGPSPFNVKGFKEDLIKQGIDTLFILGFNRDACVKDTIRDAIKAGFNVVTSETLMFGYKDSESREDSLAYFRNTKGITYLETADRVVEYLRMSQLVEA